MKRSLMVLGFVLVFIIGLATFYAIFSTWNYSKVKTPPDLVSFPSTISWGALRLGQTANCSVKLTNTGQQPTAALNMTASTPTGELMWDAENMTILPGENLIVNFTFSLSQKGKTGTFSFDIIIGF